MIYYTISIIFFVLLLGNGTSFLFPRVFVKNIKLSSNFRTFDNVAINSMRINSIISDFCHIPMIALDEDDVGGEVGKEAMPITTDAPDENKSSGMSMVKEGISFTTPLNGSDVRVGIIATRWNADVISGLYKGVNESLIAAGVKPSNMFITHVPGSFEIPLTAKFLAASKRFDVLVCLGCVIKGETMHFEYICQAASSGIMQVQLETMIPMIFGVLTVLNKEQAVARSTGSKNEGLSWGKTAVEMALARMSALGIGRTPEKSSSVSFVAFDSVNHATAATPGEGEKGKKSTVQPFGF